MLMHYANVQLRSQEANSITLSDAYFFRLHAQNLTTVCDE